MRAVIALVALLCLVLASATCSRTLGAATIRGDRPLDPTTSVHVALGVPKDRETSDDILLDHGIYALSYNPKLRVANWVAWRLVRDDLGTAERADSFHADRALPMGLYRVRPHDYAGSGYDRGHLCPSADRTSNEAANQETFAMSNMHPQVPSLNRGAWRALETYERDLVRTKRKQLFVVAGGLFENSPTTIGRGIAVPFAEYKIIVVLDAGDDLDDVTADTPIIAVVMPNEATTKQRPWSDYTVSVDEIEKRSGYDFLDRLADQVESSLESRVAAAP